MNSKDLLLSRRVSIPAGNHAFARKYNSLVPDTWHIINDRDAVPRIGKFVLLFKRPGQRVRLKIL